MAEHNSMPSSEDDASETSRSSGDDLAQDKTEEMAALDLVTRIKDYKVQLIPDFPRHLADRVQNKTPSEINAILQELHDAKKQFREMAVESRDSIADCESLFKLMRQYQVFYRIRIRSVPSTLDSGQLSTEQLDRLRFAMKYDRKAGEAVWALYETQKQLCDLCYLCEYITTFRMQHFVRKDEDTLRIQSRQRKLARARGRLRRMSAKVIQARRSIMAKVDRE